MGGLKVRVRGRYSTAVTKIVLDLGHEVVQPSDVIVGRFGLEPKTDAPHVTIKDSERVPAGLVAVGRCWAVDRVIGDLRSALGEEVFVWRSRVPLHMVAIGVVKSVSDEGYVVDIGVGEAFMGRSAGSFVEGDVVAVSVVKTSVTPGDRVIVQPGVRVDTDYVSLIPGGGVSVSRHVKDPVKRAQLVKIARDYLPRLEGYGVKWRSSSQFLDEDRLRLEIERALEALRSLEAESRSPEPYKVLQEGECVAEIVLGGEARLRMDDIRNTVTPTLIGHHALKAFARKAQLLDMVEALLGRCSDRAGFSLEFARQILSRRFRLSIVHVKPTGEVIRIGPADVLEATPESIVLRRALKPGGVLDGIGLPKEEGDEAVTCTSLGSRHVTHVYLDRNGKPKGVYINVNTPVELTTRGLMYVDLYVDVAKRWGDGDARILDIEELESLRSMGVVGDPFVEKVLNVARDVAGRVDELAEACLGRFRELVGG